MGKDLCPAHDPERDEERREYGYIGGKMAGNGRPLPPDAELTAAKADLKRIMQELEAGDIECGVGAVLIQGHNALRAYIETERRVKETEEIMARIEELEEQDTTVLRRWAG